MYARFFRWASDRVEDNGIVAFITNRSFIDSRTFDGFRAHCRTGFQRNLVVDLGGDVRANPKLSGTKHNVFGIRRGGDIISSCKGQERLRAAKLIIRGAQFETAEEKLAVLSSSNFSDVQFDLIRPDKNANWLQMGDSQYDSFLSSHATKD